MKRSLSILALVPLLLLGCKKDETGNESKPENPQKLFKVNIQASTFSESVKPMQLLASKSSQIALVNETPAITNLVLLVYDANGKLVTSKENYTVDNLYNPIVGKDKFSLTLPKGKYKLGVIGHNRLYGGLNFYLDPTDMYAHSLKVERSEHFQANVMKVFIRDSFFHDYKDFEIKSDTTLAPLKLTRLTSKLELNIEDKIVDEAAHILIGNMINTTVYPFSKDKSSSHLEGYMDFSVSSKVGLTNTVLSTPIYSNLNKPDSKETISVRVYDKNYVLISYVNIPNVTLKPNHITKLSGKLFENYKKDADGEIGVEVMKEYSSTVIQQSF